MQLFGFMAWIASQRLIRQLHWKSNKLEWAPTEITSRFGFTPKTTTAVTENYYDVNTYDDTGESPIGALEMKAKLMSR